MSRDSESDDEVLPFTTHSPREGIGRVARIVDLSEHVDAARVTPDGRCQWCGYDRGDWERHTEVPHSVSITCRQCDAGLTDPDGE